LPIEIWILLALGVVGAAVLAALRLRRGRTTETETETRNIYPLF
jgi:hypothetical protein